MYDERGQRLVVGKRLGGGGEGDVHEIEGRPDLCAKVLHPDRRTDAKFDKVQAMVAAPPAGAYDGIEGFPVLTWPRALLFSSPTAGRRTFLGYVMARVLPRDFVPFFQVTTSQRRQQSGGNGLTWDKMVLLGMRLCHVVRTLHNFGYAVGDMNDRNVLVSRRLTPLVMDTDSFQVPRGRGSHFPSIMGDQIYWAPELLDVDFAKHKGSRVTGDRHALGILLFQLFMNGIRPYQARGSLVDGLETLAAKTRAGHYPWAKPKRGVLEPPAGAPDYAALPAPIRHAFEGCFVAGHRRPDARPTADDWYHALARVRDAGFQTCAVEARHVFGAGDKRCPWCADPNDPFTPAGKAARGSRRPSPRGDRARRPLPIPDPRRGLPSRRQIPAVALHALAPPVSSSLTAAPVPTPAGGVAYPSPPTSPTPSPSSPLKVMATPKRRSRHATPPQMVVPPGLQPLPSIVARSKPAAPAPHRANGNPSGGRNGSRGGGNGGRQRQARTARPRRRAARPPRSGAKGRIVQVVWLLFFAAACATPGLLLRSLPFGFEVRLVVTFVAIVAVFLAGALLARPLLSHRKGQWTWSEVSLMAGWLIVAGALGMATAVLGHWEWLVGATAASAWVAGLVAFGLLERGTSGAFRPRPRGYVHAAVALVGAYVPVLLVLALARI